MFIKITIPNIGRRPRVIACREIKNVQKNSKIFEKQAITRGLRPMFGRVIFINIKWIFLVQGDVCGDLALIPTLPLSLNSSDLTITNVS